MKIENDFELNLRFYYLLVFRIFILTFILFLQGCFSYASVVVEDDSSYIVRGVTAGGADFEDKQFLKQNVLLRAKQMAFNDLLKFLNAKDVSFDEVNIDATISSYKIVDEYYNENYYTLIANFTFNKPVFQTFLKKNNKSFDASKLVNCIVTIRERSDIVDEYVKLRDFLKKEKIVFRPQELSSTEVKVFLENVDKNRIYDSMKALGLNGDLRC